MSHGMSNMFSGSCQWAGVEEMRARIGTLVTDFLLKPFLDYRHRRLCFCQQLSLLHRSGSNFSSRLNRTRSLRNKSRERHQNPAFFCHATTKSMGAVGYLVLGCGGGDDVPPHSRSSLRLDLNNRAELRRVNTLHRHGTVPTIRGSRLSWRGTRTLHTETRECTLCLWVVL